MDGGEGNDTLSINGNYSTLSGGEGDDIISLSSSASNNFVKFSAGDGNDTIFGFNSTDTLQITEGSYTTLQSGSDVILKIGEDSVTFKDGALTLIQIQGAEGEVETLQTANGVSNSVANTVISGTSDNDFILNSAVNVTVNAAEGNDTITNTGNNSVLNGDAGADIILSAGRTDSAFDALESETIYYISHGVNNSSIYGGKGNDEIEVVGNENLIDGGEDDDSIVVTTYGVPFSFGDAGDGVDFYASTDNTIKGGKGNDTINLSENYNSLATADEQPSTNSNTVIQYTEGDGNDIIYGLNKTDTLQIAGSYTTTKSGYDVIVKVGSGLITLSGAADIALNIATVEADKSSLLTYNAKKTAVTLASGYKGTLKSSDYDSTVKIVNASKVSSGIVINGNAQDNKILGGTGKDTIYGGKGNDSLNGGAGSDYLSGGKGSDTLTGGAGKDIFAYASGGGKDVITDYTAGTDKIKITSGTVKGSSLKGSDVVLKIGSGTLTVKKGKGQKITVVDSKGKSSTKIYGNKMAYNAKKTAVTLDSAFSGTLKSSSYSSTTKTIDASKVSKNIVINGTAKNNTITGGSGKDTIYGGKGKDSILGGAGKDKIYGDAGNDTLNGGKGSDTLTGGSGKDVFIYASGGGKDVITDYTAGEDKIKITSGKISKTSYSGKDVIFTIGSGTLTVKNGKGKKITINNSSKTYSGSSAFFAENNFVTADNLSSIVENNLSSVSEIQTQNFDSLTQENLITYAE